MADGWQQPPVGNKGSFDGFNQDIEMRDSSEMSPAAKKPRPEASFDDFIEFIDDPDIRAFLEMAPAGELTHVAGDYNPAEMGAIGEPVPYTLPWDTELMNHQPELDSRQHPAGTALSDFFGQGKPPATAYDCFGNILETERQETTPETAYDCFGDVPETERQSKMELCADGAHLASAEGLLGFQPDPMEVKRFPALPELHGSPLSDYESYIAEILKPPSMTEERSALAISPNFTNSSATDHNRQPSSEGPSRKGASSPQPKKRRGRDFGPVHIEGFAPAANPLPSNLSLEQIACFFPNHLWGGNLRPFVKAGWTGRKIWNCMQEAAKENGPKDQGWSKITKRLSEQRKRMELEGPDSAQNGVSGQTAQPWLSQRPTFDAQPIRFVTLRAESSSGSLGHNASFEVQSGHMPRDAMMRPELGQSASAPESARLHYDEQQAISQNFFDEFQSKFAPDESKNSVTGIADTRQLGKGRKRARMFPNAPSTEVVLTEQDFANLDNILENYPEHLTLYYVMKHFLRKEGARTGGYPDKEMLQKLRYHHNAKHGSDLNHVDRDQALRAWIAAQKDAARRARRGTQTRPRTAAKSHPSSGQPYQDHQVASEQQQIDSSHPDAGEVYPKQEHQSNVEFVNYAAPIDSSHVDAAAVHAEQDHRGGNDFITFASPLLFPTSETEAIVSNALQASAEQAARANGYSPAPSDPFTALLDPRLFE
jgi:hypothetical protein